MELDLDTIKGEFIESCVMLKIDGLGEEKCLEKIEILIE